MKTCFPCYVADCGETDVLECENCGKKFCRDHGQAGGDRQVQDVGAVAYPSLCDSCREAAVR
jgi:hypothetical protein